MLYLSEQETIMKINDKKPGIIQYLILDISSIAVSNAITIVVYILLILKFQKTNASLTHTLFASYQWLVILIFSFSFLVPGVLTFLYSRPIYQSLRKKPRFIPNDALVKKRAINLPVYYTLFGIIGWVIGLTLTEILSTILSIRDFHNIPQLFFRSFTAICYLIASIALNYYFYVMVNGRYLLKHFIGTEKISSIPGVIRISTRLKLFIYFSAIAVFPGFTYYNLILSLGQEITLQIQILFLLFVGLGIVMTFFISRSFQEPIDEIKNATQKIINGNYDVQVRATSLDEVGSLGESINEMARIIRSYNHSLESQVAERTHELELAKKELELSSEQKTRMFINLAHETKTPLTMIKNSLDDYIHTNGLNKHLEEMRYNLNRLIQDIVNYMDMEKLQKGLFTLDQDQIADLSGLVRKKIFLFEHTCTAHGLDLRSSIQDNVFIKSDQAAIDRILNNLLDNAVKYNMPKGVISIKLEASMGKALLTVEDTGIGMTPDDLAFVFKPYSQLYRNKTLSQGLGMGLAIVHEMVLKMDGQIQVKSALDQGTSFEIAWNTYELQAGDEAGSEYRPADYSPLIKYKPDGNVAEFTEGKPVVMVVEDTDMLRDQIKNRLEQKFNVIQACNGLEALDLLSKSIKPDLIISDIMMDGMDGFEFFDRLQAIPAQSDIPLIILSAKTNLESRMTGYAKGAIDFIQKPFELDVLKAKAEAIVRYNKIRQELFQQDLYAQIGRLSAGLTHEILNPLSGISGPLEILSEMVRNSSLKDDPNAVNSIQYINKNLVRIGKVVKSIRTLIYSKDGGPGPVFFKTAVETVINLLDQESLEKIEIENDTTDAHAFMMNYSSLEHIVLNLFNFIMDTAKTHCKIKATSYTDSSATGLSFTISDLDISSIPITKIYDLDYSAKSSLQSSCMSLYLVKALCDRNGINLSISSHIKDITSFILTKK